MGWFNYYGLAIIAIIMAPNVVYAVLNKQTAESKNYGKLVEIGEQIGRYGCIVFMIFNIPYTYFNFWFDYALIVYLSVNGGLCLIYLIFWCVCWKQRGMMKALSLSVLPACIFLFSGITLSNMPLIAFSVLFGITHIFISCKSASRNK